MAMAVVDLGSRRRTLLSCAPITRSLCVVPGVFHVTRALVDRWTNPARGPDAWVRPANRRTPHRQIHQARHEVTS